MKLKRLTYILSKIINTIFKKLVNRYRSLKKIITFITQSDIFSQKKSFFTILTKKIYNFLLVMMGGRYNGVFLVDKMGGRNNGGSE